MDRCSICGRRRFKVGEYELTVGDDKESKSKISVYNLELLTHLRGKPVCNYCMDKYHKIQALETGIDFSCGGNQYYCDGRNLE